MEASLADAPDTFRRLVAFYVSQEDSSGTCERAHSFGKHMLQNHCGPLDGTGATYSDLLSLRLDGPQKSDPLLNHGNCFLAFIGRNHADAGLL